MLRRTLISILFFLVASSSAIAFEFTEQRGDFFYDSGGALAGIRHADFPVGFERRPMSHQEKFAILGVSLPERPAELRPRWVAPKPARVQEHEGLLRNQVVVKFVEGVRVRLRSGQLVTLDGTTTAEFEALLGQHANATVRRLFSVDERILDENKDTGERIGGRELADLNNYYLIEFPEPTDESVNLANDLLEIDVVETAYLQARAEPPVCTDISPTTPLFESSQFYLDPAPTGVNAPYAWGYHAGGDGAGPSFWVMDLEWAWCLTHEDLDIDASDVVNGSTDNSFPDHGTAVLGEIGACDNDYGITGITSDVSLKMCDFDSEPSWAANIVTASTFLAAGEIMLLEIHVPGPDTGETCVCNCPQFEYVPVEWGQASFDAIETATANGVLVVEAGGNGSVNLDDRVYRKKFDLMVRDSGAILVGAGEPGSHSPECWTNHGRRIDVHGYGSQVVTGGYADLFSGSGCSQDYTGSFGGTSGASPIVVGVCSSVQGIANEKYGIDLAPKEMRALIKIGGTPQGPPIFKIIRSLPNLVTILAALEPPVAAPPTVPLASGYALSQPRPNPSRQSATMQYEIPAGGGWARVMVYDLRGRRVTTLSEGFSPEGVHSLTWDGVDSHGKSVGAGVYLVRMESLGGVVTRKVTFVP